MNTYTHGHHESVLRSHRARTAANSCAYLLPHLRGDEDLLDVGCGPATITADLAGRVRSVVGIDPSTSVIAEARADFPALDLRVGDVYAHEGRYDVVHAHQVLQHVADPVGALRAMGALTRPGGLVAVRDADYPAFAWHPADARIERWRAIYLEVTRRNGANADAGRRLLGWAQEAGLEVVSYTSSTWTYATPADRAWWAGQWAERILHSAMAAQAVDYGVAERAELEELSAAWTAWAAHADGVFILVHGEVLARPTR